LASASIFTTRCINRSLILRLWLSLPFPVIS